MQDICVTEVRIANRTIRIFDLTIFSHRFGRNSCDLGSTIPNHLRFATCDLEHLSPCFIGFPCFVLLKEFLALGVFFPSFQGCFPFFSWDVRGSEEMENR